MLTKSARELFQTGVARLNEFCVVNSLPTPLYMHHHEIPDTPEGRSLWLILSRPSRFTKHRLTGFYEPKQHLILVNLKTVAKPVPRPRPRNWSYPGYKSDRTAVGVVCHEGGHYIQDMLHHRCDLSSWNHKVDEDWRELLRSCSKQVSSYEPIPDEAFAETMRLFILNPEMLRLGIPQRYDFICELGLVPSEMRSYQEVLDGNPYYIQAAENWFECKR
jgi:hypothetical protein